MAEQDSLATVLSEFAHTLVTDFPIQEMLDHLVQRIVDILPISAAGVSLISPATSPRIVAGSDKAAIRYEHLQTELDEGPCVAAYESDEPIAIPDLSEDHRFPRFAKAAIEEGLAAVFTFPLRNAERCLGALDLYRTTPGVLGTEDMKTAQTLADAATAYLLNSEARTAKNQFVANVSHELRTPMTNIIGFTELLQDDDEDRLSEDQEVFVDAISRNSKRLATLANDLLTVSSLESANGQDRYTTVDLRAVVAAANVTLAPAIQARPLHVTFETPPDPVLVHGDASSLEALVTNLVGNAMKFTADGGWVCCTLTTSEATARLEVADNGLGIPKLEQRDLFTRFFRSSTAQQNAIQGTGLGLTIVDSIVQNHGGDIRVVSEHLEGSVFTVTLPLEQSAPAAEDDTSAGATTGSSPDTPGNQAAVET